MKAAAQVYVMHKRNGALKIGQSRRPIVRMQQIKLDHGPLVILHASEPLLQADKVERTAHRILEMAGKRVHGEREWFTTTLGEALEAIARARRIVDGLEPSLPPRPRAKVVTIALRGDGIIDLVTEMRRRRRPVPSQSEMVAMCIEAMAIKDGIIAEDGVDANRRATSRGRK